MTLSEIKNKKIAILGFGSEGQAILNYLLKNGISTAILDEAPPDKLDNDKLQNLNSLGLETNFGPDAFKNLNKFDVVFRSPGVMRLRPELISAEQNGVVITSQVKWFFEHCPGKIIGVTGTKGKGTTSALIQAMLQTAGKNSYLTGNIGKTEPLDIVDNLGQDDWIVYELSSFQLQDLDISPHIGIVLMVTSEHLDQHNNQAEYLEAKTAITKFQSAKNIAIINFDNENSVNIGNLGQGTKIFFSTKKILEQGCFVDDTSVVLKTEGQTKLTFPISALQLRGDHNLENVCAAITAAYFAGANKDSISSALETFRGLEHRLEFVTEKNGIKFYNDSYSTTPETAIAGIKSFNEPLILILGGSSKNSDFTLLGKTINESANIKNILLIGQEANNIKKSIQNKDNILEGAGNMHEVFEQIKSVAKEGDVVLLSPACASFDMFNNYRERGEQFKALANDFAL